MNGASWNACAITSRDRQFLPTDTLLKAGFQYQPAAEVARRLAGSLFKVQIWCN